MLDVFSVEPLIPALLQCGRVAVRTAPMMAIWLGASIWPKAWPERGPLRWT